MNTVYGASIVASFIAGVAALFAPCCITVLFPSYFASVFKERYKVFLMTFIFFLGILTVFLPIGLGAAALSSFFTRYHNLIFSIGGFMLLFLGLSLVLGRGFQMPFSVVMPSTNKFDAGSVYVLGIFSAMATTCCAPVLAGVLALSMASGTILWGTLYTLAYVLGMVLPLFLIAFFLDKIDFTKKFQPLRKRQDIHWGRLVWNFSWTELVSGLVFIGMGSYIIYLAFNNRLAMRSDYQITINLFMARVNYHIGHYVNYLPNWIWALIILGVFILFVMLAIKQFKNKNYDDKS